jgi:hypothetical protein
MFSDMRSSFMRTQFSRMFSLLPNNKIYIASRAFQLLAQKPHFFFFICWRTEIPEIGPGRKRAAGDLGLGKAAALTSCSSSSSSSSGSRGGVAVVSPAALP